MGRAGQARRVRTVVSPDNARAASLGNVALQMRHPRCCGFAECGFTIQRKAPVARRKSCGFDMRRHLTKNSGGLVPPFAFQNRLLASWNVRSCPEICRGLSPCSQRAAIKMEWESFSPGGEKVGDRVDNPA